MEPFWSENFGNPSSIYHAGIKAKEALSQARGKIAKILGAKSSEIVFTAGGTESANLAILGLGRARGKNIKKPGHIITTEIEHPAVLNAVRALEKKASPFPFFQLINTGWSAWKK